MTRFFRRGLDPADDPWEDELVTHAEVVRWLPASIRADFQPPNPFAALAACGVSIAEFDRWAPPTRAELNAGVQR